MTNDKVGLDIVAFSAMVVSLVARGVGCAAGMAVALLAVTAMFVR